jgi:hypothetical protein
MFLIFFDNFFLFGTWYAAFARLRLDIIYDSWCIHFVCFVLANVYKITNYYLQNDMKMIYDIISYHYFNDMI